LRPSIVQVKWNKTTFDNIEVDTTQTVDLLKAQLYGLSNVPPEKQKLMFKGKILKVSVSVSL